MQSETGYASVNGANIYYEVMGEGENVILIHGGLVHSDLWNSSFPAFAERFRTLRYDARQHGRSLPVPGPFSHHEDLISLMEAMEMERAHLVGLSMGGGIALETALQRPESVDSLTLVGAGTDDWEWSEEIASSWRAVGEAYGNGDLGDAIEITLKTWTDGPGRSPSETKVAAREAVRSMTAHNFELPDADAVEIPLSPPPLPRLEEVQVPTLVVLGDEDVDDILRLGAMLASSIEGACEVRITNSAHHLPLEEPKAFEKAVFDFLRDSS